MKICPDCSADLQPSARKCACGWKLDARPQPKQHALGYPQCSRTNGDLRCMYPGSMTGTTQADEHTDWVCRFHYDCLDPVSAAAIVEESQSYIHSPRRDHCDVPAELRRQPGESRQDHIERLRKQCMAAAGAMLRRWRDAA